jgi:hypothetical protein
MKSAITKVGNDHYWTDLITYVQNPLMKCYKSFLFKVGSAGRMDVVCTPESYSNSTAFYTIQRLIIVFPHLHTHNFSFWGGGGVIQWLYIMYIRFKKLCYENHVVSITVTCRSQLHLHMYKCNYTFHNSLP